MEISIVQNTRTVEAAINILRRVLSDHAIFNLTYSGMVCVSVVLDLAPQLLKLWRNDSGSTGKQKTFK